MFLIGLETVLWLSRQGSQCHSIDSPSDLSCQHPVHRNSTKIVLVEENSSMRMRCTGYTAWKLPANVFSNVSCYLQLSPTQSVKWVNKDRAQYVQSSSGLTTIVVMTLSMLHFKSKTVFSIQTTAQFWHNITNWTLNQSINQSIL